MNDNDIQVLLDYLQSFPLGQGVSADALSRHAEAGTALGEKLARLVREEFHDLKLEEILRREGVNLEPVDAPVAEGVQILAEYQAQPPTIRIYPRRIENTRRKLSGEQKTEMGERLREIALAHELYHHFWQRLLETEKDDTGSISAQMRAEVDDPSWPQKTLHSALTQEAAALVFTRTFLALPGLPALEG